jgi:hypothetical protein
MLCRGIRGRAFWDTQPHTHVPISRGSATPGRLLIWVSSNGTLGTGASGAIGWTLHWKWCGRQTSYQASTDRAIWSVVHVASNEARTSAISSADGTNSSVGTSRS